MNVDEILSALNEEQVDYLLIGGMNFLIRHLPELTFDVDIWVREEAGNLARLNRALRRLGAQWLETQGVFCMTTQHGALDIFREVRGLEGRYAECKGRSVPSKTAAGTAFSALSDEDMLACQEALPPGQRKARRVEVLQQAIRRAKGA